MEHINRTQIKTLGIIPEYQNKGLGSTLLNYLVDFITVCNFNNIFKETNKNAISFYKRHSFIANRKIPDCFEECSGIEMIRAQTSAQSPIDPNNI